MRRRAITNRAEVQVLRELPGGRYLMEYMRSGQPQRVTVEADSDDEAIQKFHQLDAVARLSAPLPQGDMLFKAAANRGRQNPRLLRFADNKTPEWATEAAIAKNIAERIHGRINSAQDFIDSDRLSEAFGAILGANKDFSDSWHFDFLDELPEQDFVKLTHALDGVASEMYERLQDFTNQKREIDRRIAAGMRNPARAARKNGLFDFFTGSSGEDEEAGTSWQRDGSTYWGRIDGKQYVISRAKYGFDYMLEFEPHSTRGYRVGSYNSVAEAKKAAVRHAKPARTAKNPGRKK